ncbi:MAG: hypothetical protein JJU34_05550 [Lunatimonas sp.]|uniref:hypothetical protein n=1 Tax=Lunatimonas sp. TaxID=2060141 RepID=UPI00263BE0B6|nr:hypothetical protein [Lunatimonas sp.]MCC5936726.1 hypothetical protein [Lunatimonas sp.]
MIQIAKNTIYFYLIPLFLFFGSDLSAQTYTTVGGGCTEWTNPACWTKVNVLGCTNSTSLSPPFSPNANACPVSVIIRHPMNVPGNRTFGGNFVSITAEGADGLLIFDQNVTIAAGRSIEFITNNGAEIRVNGELILNQGPGGPSATPTQLNVSGDKTGKVSANDTKINNNTTLNVLAGGNFINSEVIDIQGLNRKVEIWGEFQTRGLVIRGGSSNQLNTYGDALVNVEESISLAGSTSEFWRE